MQMTLLNNQPTQPIVNYYNKGGALRTGKLLRIIKRGRLKGMYIVAHLDGCKAKVRVEDVRDIVGQGVLI